MGLKRGNLEPSLSWEAGFLQLLPLVLSCGDGWVVLRVIWAAVHWVEENCVSVSLVGGAALKSHPAFGAEM